MKANEERLDYLDVGYSALDALLREPALGVP